MAYPHGLENTIRAHDEAFYNWLGTLKVDYGDMGGLLATPRDDHPILRIFAGPSRAFASLVSLLVNTGFVSGNTAEKMQEEAGNFAVLPLPAATIERGKPEIDFEKALPPKTISTAQFDTVNNQWTSHPNPGTYNLTYTVTFWAIKQYTLGYIEEWILSNFGKLGGAANETYLDVAHPAPWSTFKQSLKLDSISDLSELEGENPVYRRVEVSFRMRMLNFHREGSSAEQVFTVEQGTTLLDTDDGTLHPGPSSPDLSSSTDLSGNLFVKYVSDTQIPTQWKKQGSGAAVSSGVMSPAGTTAAALANALKISVTADSDEVDIAHRMLVLDKVLVTPRALLSVAFRYWSEGTTTLNITQRDAASGSAQNREDVYTLPLPPTGGEWKQVHFFTFVARKIFGASISGAGSVAEIHLADISIRHVTTLTTTTATASLQGSNNEFSWTGLTTTQPYLVYVPLITSGGAVSANVSISDDVSVPAFTRLVPATNAHRGVAGIIQPKVSGTTIKVSVPDTLLVLGTTAFLQTYAGDFNGHDI
jgi:hypothetical protein